MSGKTREEDFLSIARKRLETAAAALDESRQNELDDLKFAAGNSDNKWQWPTDALATRTDANGLNARPCLTINKLPQHIKQVTNDQRQNRPAGKVIPADDGADVEMAEIYDGMVRHIEYASDAPVAYDTACDNQVTYGEGYWRIVTKYVDPMSFDQDIFIERIRNSFSVYPDPMMQSPFGKDMKWCFITEDILHDEYEKQYPDASPISTLTELGVGDKSIAAWINEKTIRIAEYFCFDETTKKLYLYPDGVTALEGSPERKAYEAAGVKPVRSRDSEEKKVKWYKTNGYEILEERDWAGKYIPVIRVPGNEFEVEGKVYVSGIVRNAKDPQRMYNYWTSQEAEMLALAPKAPFIGYGGQFEGYETQWKTANTKNWPYLEVNAVVDEATQQVLPLPQRSVPPMVQSGLIAAKQASSEDIKETTGQYNASLGQVSNERSGKAILAREHAGDVSTYHYGSNLAMAVQYSTLQLIDLIPKIYDTPRIARTLGEDNESKMVRLDPNQPEAVRTIRDENNVIIQKIYNPGVGKYDVIATTGPGYLSKRKEAAEGMATILQTNPELWGVAGDLFVKNLDWPGSPEMAKRLKKTIDPKLLAEDDDPALQQAQQQIQQMGMELQQALSMLQNVQNSLEYKDVEIKAYEAQIKAYDAETKRIQVTQAGMSPEQVQEIVRGTIDAAIHSGDLIGQMPAAPQVQQPQQEPGVTDVQPGA